MSAHAVPIDIKEQGVTWLLPPYSLVGLYGILPVNWI